MNVRTRTGIATTLAALSWMALAEPVLACPVCFGASDAPPVHGMRMAILALLGVTVVVLGAFAGFFVYLMRRARMTANMGVGVQQVGARGRSY